MVIDLFWFVLLPILFAVFSYLIYPKKGLILVLFFQFLLFYLAVCNFLEVKANGTRLEILGGYPQGIGISLKSDLVSAVLIMLVIFLFTNMILFNYHKDYVNYLFRLLYLILEGLICALFLSNDLFNIFVLVEVSTIIVSILIIFKKYSQSIYDGIIYLFSNLIAASFFLFGIGILYRYFGVLDISLLTEAVSRFDNPPALFLPFAMIITGLSLKSAVMPLFSWLPKAHGTPSAPSIVSAILSGIYIKCGLFIFVRVSAIFHGVIDVGQIFIVMGALTAVVGFIFALSQTDIKLILAYHTVSQVGLMMLGLSLGTEYAYYGAFYHLINHAVFKSTLFLTAGIMIEEYHTRNLYEIKGLWQKQPLVALATLVSILGITGAPLFNGSYSKYLIEKGGLHLPFFDVLMLIINLGTIVSFVKYSSVLKKDNSQQRVPLRFNQSIVILTLAAVTFLGGLFGPYLSSFFFGISKPIYASDYLIKLGVYLLSIAVCYLFYRFFYHKIALFKKIRQIELSFNEIVLSMFIFFCGMYFYLIVFGG
ncbi:proton-conducting membrane transporter [Clostridiales bacterium COT073_COT-073]|nr:proton-conducting membrane transporter [Clostridiales bacterium COT073_COT-073]